MIDRRRDRIAVDDGAAEELGGEEGERQQRGGHESGIPLNR
jgi:hypothetical protein